jgi:hypothetical protein
VTKIASRREPDGIYDGAEARIASAFAEDAKSDDVCSALAEVEAAAKSGRGCG